MLLLEPANRIIADLLTEKFNKPSALDQAFVDFDSVRYHLSTPVKKTQLLLSMDIPCWAELVQHGADDLIQREYGAYITQTEHEYALSLLIDVDNLPLDQEARVELIKSFSLLKRNALAAPFERAFTLQKQLDANPPTADAPPTKEPVMAVHYRPEEAIYIQPSIDRVTVIFSTIFKEETDRIFGKVFLQEFVDARRRPSCQTAPQVLYSNREPPLEIRHLPGLADGENVGYVTFVLFPRHFSSPLIASASITQIQLFRDYLHYHIKCSKAYMHSRMRLRGAEFLKVLNRAKPDQAATGVEKERKTARSVMTGRDVLLPCLSIH
ncbi:BZ3500_MvSof-1268-A1-R1_Chr3-1g06178 [Microbotryum saponariae]|uniref:Arp2/3 complex 34 kDa subunit n=1 Tax=Microbotryum saponariae TaxID=289078 RepID=A0A2X0L2I0_9BASI|nr:BZ3500_MvSof-1268-A1-R1_Chr3-1g06178 [Microbotryum saponariae]SDA04061.1 BZ3501_MvSof-1269-A2-R1_Chr3-2g05863 [Microbotryum saponariae]